MAVQITTRHPHLEHLDLGTIEEPLLICGGAYSNLEAVTALLEAAAEQDIPCDRIIHTGDAIAYGADPVATAALIRDTGIRSIKGNVEESLAVSARECGCGFTKGSVCETLSARWFSYADQQIDDDLRNWMATLPRTITFTTGDQRVRAVHGGVTSINAFIHDSDPPARFAREFSSAGADIIVAGHCGLPFTKELGIGVWHNAGALGLPANDGTPRVWYSLLVPDGDRICFEHRALRYDHETAHQKMRAAGLPERYATALISGLWPSLDTLPAAERRDTGRPIPESTCFIGAKRLARVG